MAEKVAIIFGHSSGLGRAVTEELLNEDYHVIGISRSQPSLQSPNLTNYSIDLSKKDEVERVLEIIQRDHAQFDLLIYAAGLLSAHNIDQLDYDDMEYTYRVNTFAAMYVESKLVPLIKENGTDVINITSSSVKTYYPGYTEYSSSKMALTKFTQDLKQELQDSEARVTDICPSGFQSNIYKVMRGEHIERDESKQMKAEDIASLIMNIIKLPKKIEVSYVYLDRK